MMALKDFIRERALSEVRTPTGAAIAGRAELPPMAYCEYLIDAVMAGSEASRKNIMDRFRDMLKRCVIVSHEGVPDSVLSVSMHVAECDGGKRYHFFDPSRCPVSVAYLCGVSVPLDPHTPYGIVGDWIAENVPESDQTRRLCGLLWRVQDEIEKRSTVGGVA